jgi:hypothetical protein
MTKEEKELTITYLTEMQEEYIEGEGYERHPLPEYYALDMAIKALNQPTSDDCVSRQAVTDAVENTIAKYIPTFIGPYEKIPLELARAIKDLPPVAPTQRWIPVSERLPEPNTAVLTYISTGPSETFCLAYWNDIQNYWEDWIGYKSIEKDRGYKVLAWQPLPKPYEEK